MSAEPIAVFNFRDPSLVYELTLQLLLLEYMTHWRANIKGALTSCLTSRQILTIGSARYCIALVCFFLLFHLHA